VGTSAFQQEQDQQQQQQSQLQQPQMPTARLVQCSGYSLEQHDGIIYVYTTTMGAFGYGRYLVGPLAFIDPGGLTCMAWVPLPPVDASAAQSQPQQPPPATAN
jgi:hypothetical protein